MDLTQRTRSHHSELGDLSDSDWLDIASSRASEDDDSVAGFDSDREDADGRPFSRHSFSSLASSSDEVVEGWEGLIEDSADETPLPRVEHPTDLHNPADVVPNDPSPPAEAAEDPEDERVKAALDQSMISTLSSSRSSSLANSLQTSIVHSTRSLRLSFPDPTTSRLQSLSTSFEEIPPSDVDHPTSEDGKAPSTGDGATADPLRPPSPEPAVQVAVSQVAFGTPTLPANTTFTVFLYGSCLASKMSFVDMLLEKWALGLDLPLSQKVSLTSRIVVQTFKGADPTRTIIERVVTVVDKTGPGDSPLIVHAKCPSLAIVFLPSISDLTIPEHTLYLPVMMTSPLSPVDVLCSTDYLLEAEQQWEAQGIAQSKLTGFSSRSSPVVDEEAVARASHEQVEQALRALLSHAVKKVIPKVSAHAVTIMAILSIVLAYIMNGVADTSNRRLVASAVTSPLMNLLRPAPMVVNKSMATPSITIPSSGSSLSLTSLRDLQISVFTPSGPPADVISASGGQEAQPPASTSVAAAAAATTTASVVEGPSECECGCGLLTWPAKTDTTDLMLRPTSSAPSILTHTVNSVSIIPSHTPSIGKGKGKAIDSDSSLYALSTRMATSLTEYFGFSPIAHAVVTDLQELIVALDQLADTIARQTAIAWEQTRGVMAVVSTEFKYRNDRAKARAQQLREASGVWFSSFKDHIIDRAAVAKENARSLRHQFRARRLDRRRQRQVLKQEKLKKKLEEMAVQAEREGKMARSLRA